MTKAAKTGRVDLFFFIDQPVVGNDQHITVSGNFIQVPHNEGPIQAACHLFPRLVVRVISERPGIIEREAVPESFARLNSGLRQVRNAVHLIDVAYSMPVNGRGLVQIIDKLNVEDIAFGSGNKRARGLPIIQP